MAFDYLKKKKNNFIMRLNSNVKVIKEKKYLNNVSNRSNEVKKRILKI